LEPREYSHLDKRWRAKREWDEYLVGVLASTVANTSMMQRSKAFVPADFMISQKHKKRPLPSDDEVAASIDAALMPISIRG
jgi:hypothetical protein